MRKFATRTARNKLQRGRQPHWQDLVTGKVHIGYQCRKGEPAGRWLLRRYVGNKRYRIEALGTADDDTAADGCTCCRSIRRKRRASEKVATGQGKPLGPLTVRGAWARYVAAKRDEGKDIDNMEGRGKVHILPELGDLIVSELTTDQLRRWLATMAAAPAQKPSKGSKPKYRDAPASEDEIRARRASANRVLTMLRAALNHAFGEGLVTNRNAWDGKRLKPFENVEVARVRYLQIDEATRLINACNKEFRPMVHAALETGCRYSELTRLVVNDFNPDAGTVAVGKSEDPANRAT